MEILRLNIRGRLILGFSILCMLLAAVVGTTIMKVVSVSNATDRTVNLRVPTAMTASDVVSSVYGLSSHRCEAGCSLEIRLSKRNARPSGRTLMPVAPRWIACRLTGPLKRTNRSGSRRSPLLDELRKAQDKAEAIAHTLEEQPAAKVLATEAAPLASLMLQKATTIINEEGKIGINGSAQKLADRLC